MSRVQPAFLLSLPRSGSTLLQRMVGAHSRVATVAEPWLLLAPLYALRQRGVLAEYGHATAATALRDLTAHLPDGEDGYLRAVADMAGRVYDELSPPSATTFLDKTPRYALVVDELLRAFPASPVVVLHRNPLAVLGSISDTWLEGRWEPHLHKVDLYLALERVLAAQVEHPDRVLAVRYEDLVDDAEATLEAVMAHLGLVIEPGQARRFSEVAVPGRMGDPTGVVAYDAVSTAPLDGWRTALASPVRRAWSRRYLRWIGEERLALMGYDLTSLLTDLRSLPPGWAAVPADVAHLLKGVAQDVLEPQVVREKVQALPAWHAVLGHR